MTRLHSALIKQRQIQWGIRKQHFLAVFLVGRCDWPVVLFPVARSVPWTVMQSRAWERELCWFIWVPKVILFLRAVAKIWTRPRTISVMICLKPLQYYRCKTKVSESMVWGNPHMTSLIQFPCYRKELWRWCCIKIRWKTTIKLGYNRKRAVHPKIKSVTIYSASC